MTPQDESPHQAWARFRFAVVGMLWSCPPPRGQLRSALKDLARKTWQHPITGEGRRFGLSTIERWYYAAQSAPKDPVGALRRQVRSDAGARPSLSNEVRQILSAQHTEHPSWSYKLHADNLVVLIEQDPRLGLPPSYSSVRRHLKAQGLTKQRRYPDTAGGERSARRQAALETRRFEVAHVHGLWHLDFHGARRRVLTSAGQYITPQLLAVIDDRSRLCCHLQWYLGTGVEELVHGLMQALQKRGLPRALMHDNGSAMRAGEFLAGLEDLGIQSEPTLCYSPQQNGKQEHFFAIVEGRLMAMLENVPDLGLDLLNRATQAWCELEYNHRVHSETGLAPLRRLLDEASVGRDCPDGEVLRAAFRQKVSRRQRRSDGTLVLGAVRLEVPSAYRHLERLHLRYARWDLTRVDLYDPRTQRSIARLRVQDLLANAQGHRRALAPLAPAHSPGRETQVGASGDAKGLAPLLCRLMQQYQATGLPPAYLLGPQRPGKDPRR